MLPIAAQIRSARSADLSRFLTSGFDDPIGACVVGNVMSLSILLDIKVNTLRKLGVIHSCCPRNVVTQLVHQ